ncbi:dystonin isoform X11 [Thrips palmi]|uniref:Dystonin isoform X11 n=1 Tax=Thrips palmi TaxID=161013 RepID=A0A6P8ZVT4_THRPL|nr:dystonin isoform X11 [Thrips palmi]XP_034249444.1 dystonin isoform X11 [Thrips palmi]XP_034249452.1 dystonin isoform X11 [Thrips palmi]XP_034249461.1 dystonin isoform X11 [Thrips palmi]
MSSQSYYKERLGFDPNEAANDAVTFDKNKQGYEENLSKFKGLWDFFIQSIDERDAIQKKTFTKWVNKHLKKHWKYVKNYTCLTVCPGTSAAGPSSPSVNRHVTDLFEDLRDGHNLISLLEVLSGEPLPRERGSMRFHMLQNVQMCLDFLYYKKIKLVNIRAEDIVDGNPKLTLGLIWTIILHFQISDIVVGQEPNVSARDALLRWARRSTAKYPGVQVRDFTASWRDGLAFNAIIHRNRPDLVDWTKIRKRAVRERLETAFFLAEREFGVTRLLDPEDVDTNEPDEKSLITYISSMYETFPEPPQQHPLYDSESSARLTEYRDLASDLTRWMREKMTVMQDRHFPNTLIEMKKLANESVRFRNEEVPPRQRDKQRLQHMYRELQSEVDLESSELHIEVIDRQWNRLMIAHQDRDVAIQEEIKRLERLQRLAEKVHREIKQVDSRLEELEVRVEEEARRLDRLHPLDSKRNLDALEQDIRIVEENIQTLFGDVQTLRDGRYPQAPELLKRVQKLHQRWVELRSLLHKKLIAPLSNMSFPVEERTVRREKVTVVETRLVDTNQHFQNLQECAEWVRNKLKQLQEAEYGSDLPGVQTEISIHQREHKTIEQFHTKIEHCVDAKANFHGEELQLYNQHLSVLHKLYADLLTASNKRTSDLEILHDFLQSATNELMWLNEKEEVEVSRDWSDKNLNLPAVEQYYESLMSDLEKREIQFSAVLDRGEALILQHHPATKTIEAYMKAMQSQWSWVLQLTLCLETHLKHAHNSQQFFKDVKEAEHWINKRDEALNSTFSASEFSLDEGERLLKGMQELREELNAYGDVVTKLAQRAKEIVPMKQRRMPVTKPMPVVSICSYKQANANIEKGDPCVLHDNSGRIKWRVVSRAGIETQVPGVVFLLPPPDKEALEAIDRLRRQFDRTVALWQKKQMRLRQNMIFATIKVVKSWDLEQFLAMGQDQRNAIRRALNEDADKLLQEGDPTDPQLRRLRREMEEVNRLFDEFERRARELEESKNATRRFNEQSGTLQQKLDEMERILNQRINSFLPRDLDSLEHLVIEHKEFETRLQSLQPEVDRVQETFRSVPQKTPALQQKLDKCLQKWNSLWNCSHLYIERLKCVEVVLTGLEEATNAVSEFEMKLASYDKMPSDIESLQRLHEDLLNLQSAVSQQQIAIDQLNEDAVNARRLVEKSRSTSGHRGAGHPDVDRLEADVERITKRWNNVCNQLVERLRSCEAGYGLLQKFANTYEAEVKFVDESYKQLNAIAPSKHRALEQLDNTKALYNNVVERAKPIEAVNVDGGRFIREAKQAMEEKYRLCDESLQKLLQWIAEVEDRLANQDVVHEQVDELRNQINNLKVMKDDLDAHARPVSACLDQVRLIVSTGGELLSSVEMASLEKNGKGLRTRYDRALNRTDLLLRRLAAARDELTKFRGEMTQFVSWLDKARRVLEDKERSLSNLNRLTSGADSTREFVSDVIAHQADLRFITMAAQKFVDESKEYLTVLNDFRTSLPQRLPHVEAISAQDSVVRNEVSVVTAQYKDLLNRCNALTDRLSGVGGRQREYRDAVDKARAWLKEVEPRAHKIIAEPIGADPKTVEDQLHRAKQLNSEFVANARLIDNARQALAALLRSLDGQLTPAEARDLEQPVVEIEAKYNQLAEALADKCAALDTALTQSQGVQDALDGLVGWLNSSDNQLKTQWRPASLIKERLEEQIREHRQLQAEIDSHKASVEAVARSAQELVNTASNSRLAKKIETKLHDVTSRFDKLLDKVAKRGEFLDEVMAALMTFSNQATLLERWLSEMLEVLDSRELPEVAARLEDLAAKRDAKREPFEEAIRNGRNLVGQKDVTDTGPVRDRIKGLESQWKELNGLLDEKTRLSRARAEQLSAYDRLRDQVMEWLSNMENRLARLEAIALDAEYLKKQSEEIKPLVKEHRDYAGIIDKVNDLGNAYDALTQGGRPDSPARRRSGAYSPTKRLSSTASPIGRRSSQDALLTSPVSPGGSSGFGSRRSSQDGGFHLDEVSPVQQQLTEINNRYSLLGVRLGDRQTELDQVREEVRKILENLRTLSVFLDKVQRALPKESVPMTKDEADKMTRQIKSVLEEMYEKQSLLDGTRGSVQELLRRKPGARGADTLHDEMAEVASRWRALHDLCKARIKLMEDMKDFHDTHDSLSGWLAAKDRMLTVLGPISSDPRMVQSQVQQVQVLREEFRTQQPQLNHLLEVGDAVLAHVDRNSGDGQRIAAKLDQIQQRWNDLLGRLEERAESLGAAADTSREFDAQLTRLRDALQAISDALDDLPLDKDPEEQLRKIENLERQLEGQRPLLADVEAAGAQLCEVLTDPASRADIQAKLAAVIRQYNTLQKKLDHRKAEIEGSLRDGRQFEQSCARTLGWLSDELGGLSERLLVSADRDVLQEQLDKHEPVYKAVLNREHEVIMLLNKGRDMQARAGPRGDARNLGRDLDKIQQAWDRLRKDVLERHTRLQTCMEHCRKYYRAQEQFLPWLLQAEDKLESLQPASFKRKDIERQLKELAAFRNDVWKRSGEYENNRMLGETFVGSCDIDKDIVKNELTNMKQRWDRLNNGLLERTQALEETARRLGDFGENLRDLAHAVQRCEDKLASHDAIGGAARDPKMLERIRALREEAGNLKKPLLGLRQAAGDLVKEAGEHGVDAHHLQDEVEGVGDRIDELCAKLDDRCSQLQSAATAVSQFNEQVKALGQDLTGLENELDAMKPPGREIKVVRAQLEDVSRFLKKVSRAADDVARAVQSGEHLVDSGFASDTVATRDQVESLRRQLARLEERGRNREEDLDAALGRLESFYQQYAVVMEDINHAAEQVRKLKPIGSDLDSIKAQQEEFRHFRRATIEPLGATVGDTNRAGQGLVQSAAGGVSTAVLEKDLEKLNDRWNDLKEKMNERDRRLDVGLLQSGKFQEALDGLSKWLSETEEMVAKQKPPSADYKVVKAQLQEQKFLKKMLLDRQNSMSSLFAMGNEVAANADPAERKAIERQLKDLMGRFDRLTEGAQQRMEALEMAMAVAKQFQDKLVPIMEWLDKTERKVKDLELVPTDEEKIQQKIREHDALHKEILRKKAAFTELTEVASTLMELVGEDEAAGLADKLTETTDRYATLVEASEAVGALLQQSRQGLRHLVLTYQDLQAWMEKMEKELNRHRVLAVHTDKLLQQMDDLADLTEEIANKQTQVDGTVDSGLELMKHISNDEAIQLKDKLDSLQRRYNDLTSRGADLLKHAQEALPLVQQFHNCHTKLVDWMMGAEATLQQAEPREEDIHRLELDIQEFRPVLEAINQVGPRLCQMSPGEGASTIEGLMTRDNRRFDAIAEQIQRKAERIQLSKQRSLEVISDIDELLDWFREVENQIREAEPPSSDPDVIRVQLKEHKALNDDISSQKGRVRDVLSTAKKVLRESAQQEDTGTIREKMEDLREMMELVSGLSADRLGILEQALPLAQHFLETHATLASWLTDMERQVAMLAMPSLRPDLIAQQQDRNEMFLQSLNEHKPLLDKLNKTGEALISLVNDEEGSKVQDVMDGDNARYNALRVDLRTRQQALEKALQESSQFADKLEGMLRALTNTADQVNNMEPVSAHPPKIRDQIDDNNAIVEDLDKRQEAYDAVKRAATDVINKAGNRADPAVNDIKRKLEKLNSLWNDVQKATGDRGKSLDEALRVAQKFWEQLHAVMATLRDLQDTLQSQDPPAVEPSVIKQQQHALQDIRHDIDQTKPEVDQVRQTGQKLMKICGEPDKPEVKKNIEDLDSAWDNITALYARREENLIDAMEKAMEFHEMLQNLLAFLDKAEDKFAHMGALGSDIDAVKRQISQLKDFKHEVDPHMVKVEALNRQAQELTERTSADQAAAIKEPLNAVNRRWDDLLRGMVERQRQLENALLRLGQFQHALSELLAWIDATERTLDSDLKPVPGDPQLLEVELAKLKVLVNDIQAHQSSVDTLNDAGRQLIESGKGTLEASSTQEKLSTLNRRWRELLQKAADRQTELEDALREAQRYHAEVQDLLSWLGEVDGVIAASKPVGGLPETASEQLQRFMEVYNELEENRPKVESCLAQGHEYLKKSSERRASNLEHNLRTLKQRWDSVTARANDKKIKLEIALKEATEFHDALQAFVDWLTNAEKVLSNLKPVSRVMETILQQIEEHKAFQKDVGVHRETMLNLDKKGTHLKYFSQKQDVILIKNLLISVQHRWERVVSKSAERTRALDHGYKEAREFHDAWSGLMSWLTDTEKGLEELQVEEGVGNDPDRIKQRLAKHREFQRALSGKQATYDATMRAGKTLKDRAPKTDETALRNMLTQLKNKWTAVCAMSVERQRRLEEALLYCGQFKDAVQALMDWLYKMDKILAEDGPVHGDLDTVMALVEQHKQFEEDLSSRSAQMESVKRTGKDLMDKATAADAAAIRSQLSELTSMWDKVSRLSDRKTKRLEDALKEAEALHKAVHMLLEWLSDAEMKLRFSGTLPEDEHETRAQLAEHEKFMREMREKEREKDQTIALAQRILAKAHPDGATVIKHWITIIQSRWEEVSSWAKQREQRLNDHLRSLRDLDSLLEELLSWLQGLESNLLSLEAEPLPDDLNTLRQLIQEHQEFMENTAVRQGEVDAVCKSRQVAKGPAAKDKDRRPSKPRTSLSSRDLERESSPEYEMSGRKGSRASPGREKTPDIYPHIGPRFPPKGSKGAEPQFRSPRVKLLWDKWRNVWMLSWERQRRLQEKYNYLLEMERVKNFSWDDWRRRFLKFMNHKKSRLTDLFRKMDKNNDGLIPREDFIDGIIKTKFDTSRLEMNAVADMFDHNNEGLIDWKEFIAALRPDWEEKQPSVEADKIHDEVKRLVMLCTCRQKFRVFQVGEGKYRFGDSQKLRLVRILRSTVMVRVGGGWVALDEFLVKNDPCRAKGRTNIELREQFILADGVSQSMSAFKPKHSSSSSQRSASLSSAGPITKIRERSARSVPMKQSSTGRSSFSAASDSLSDNEGSFSRGPPTRKSSAPLRSSLTPGGSLPGSRNNSRPPSRQGSKPPSRHGSNLSLDSTDEGTPSRIPMRRVTSSTPSSAQRKLTVPMNGSATRPRTPTSGLTSPASGAVSRLGTIHRASSIPTLTGVGSSGSRIPIYVGASLDTQDEHLPASSFSCPTSGRSSGRSSVRTNSSSNIPVLMKAYYYYRARTPSGSSTPAPPGLGTKLTRRASGASDTSTGARKGKTSPAPFHL